ncbi:hypothetical protein JYU14_04255 [Simkania negevensis]|uniref:Uncharacterized protein n=1 Tax=Simkania negevensis TaxID=83561 RepID=A0ABS3ARB2_9BACT|nr:hypothetical protein [Simkania negevensis]
MKQFWMVLFFVSLVGFASVQAASQDPVGCPCKSQWVADRIPNKNPGWEWVQAESLPGVKWLTVNPPHDERQEHSCNTLPPSHAKEGTIVFMPENCSGPPPNKCCQQFCAHHCSSSNPFYCSCFRAYECVKKPR